MITLEGLTKRYGATRAVDSLDLTVSPGRVTGFLSPNGAGRSTTMRMIRTVFVSSHLMSEMQLTADQLVVIGRGRLIADAPVAEVIAGSSRTTVVLRVPDPEHRAVLRERLIGEAERVES